MVQWGGFPCQDLFRQAASRHFLALDIGELKSVNQALYSASSLGKLFGSSDQAGGAAVISFAFDGIAYAGKTGPCRPLLVSEDCVPAAGFFQLLRRGIVKQSRINGATQLQELHVQQGCQ